MNLAGLSTLGMGAVGASVNAAREHFADRAMLESLNLKIRMICPADLLPAVNEAVARCAALGRRHNPETIPNETAALLAATEAVYRDLAAGWLPEVPRADR